ncbi:MAG TPA: LD-carboxypeptidase [Vicinamibacteria bacterium]
MTRKPRALRPGDTVALCAPSGPIEPEFVATGIRELEGMGFRVLSPPDLDRRTRFTAGPVERRVAELHDLFENPEVRAIVCARGGAGALALLPHLDPSRIEGDAKVFVGYSDVTALHLFLGRLGLVTIHGPMAGRSLVPGRYHRESFLAALTGEGAPYASEPDDLLTLREGEGVGILRGGCLSLLAAAAGTPWALRPDDEGTILFLEDIRERPFRIDRMLTQLRLAGAFENVRGIVFGEMKGCGPAAGEDYTLEEVLLESLSGLDLPMAIGLSSGHTNGPNVSLPLGVRARLTCGVESRLEVLESAVA